jgi:hypothetical protein
LACCGTLLCTDVIGVLGGNGGNESSVASGVVLRVVWDLLGPLNWLCKSDGRGAGEGGKDVDRLEAVEGPDWLHFPGTRGN